MIRVSKFKNRGYSHVHVQDFVGVDNVESRDTFSLTLWPDGVNTSNEPEAIGCVNIESDFEDGEPTKETAVLISKEAALMLRDMLNERFPA